VAIIFIIGILLIIIGIIPFKGNLGYTLGSAMGQIAIWLLSAGIVMFLRPILYKAIIGTKKIFSKKIGICLIILGGIGLLNTIISRIIHIQTFGY
jgi:hypothetical protein